MGVNPPDHVNDARLAEFRALRDESLRCAQLLSSAVWVAVTGYAVTIGAGAAFLGRAGAGGRQVREELLMPSIVALLCLEAIAISAMYLSELWKYIRVGAYIRKELGLPMNWETWIEKHRAYELYIGSVALLQLPVIITLAGGLFAWFSDAGEPGVPVGTVREFAGWLFSDRWLTAIIIAIVLGDALVVTWLGWRLALAVKGKFARPSPVAFVREFLRRRVRAHRAAG